MLRVDALPEFESKVFELLGDFFPQSGLVIRNAVSDILAIIARVREHFSIHFSVDGQCVSGVECDRVEDEHAEQVESAGSHPSIGESCIDTQIPTSHLFANQATGNMTRGMTISCVD